MRILLPYKEPLFLTYHYMASHGIVAGENPTGVRWFYNHATGLSCFEDFGKENPSPKLIATPHGVLADQNLETYIVNIWFCPEDAEKTVRSMLDAGYYVLFDHVDDYFIEGKSFYGTRHFYHDGLILGYDGEAETLTLAAYDSRWNYGVWQTPAQNFFHGVLAAAQSQEHPRFIAARTGSSPVALDLSLIAESFRSYLEPASVSENGRTRVSGLSVYEALIRYLEMLAQARIPHEKMDWRVMRLLWEHKKCVLGCLCDAENALSLGNGTSGAYRAVVQRCHLLRLEYAMYHEKEKESLLASMIRKLREVRETEELLLRAFAENLEKKGY